MNETNKSNKTLNNPNNMIQQQFHKSLFIRHRSNSLPSVAASTPTNKQGQNENETDIHEDHSSSLWQNDKVLPIRQKRKKTSPIHRENKKKPMDNTTFSVPTHNQFDILNSAETEEPAKEYIPKPEPIFVTGVLDVTSLKTKLNNIVEKNSYKMTTLRSGHIIKLMPNDIQTYKTIREKFVLNNIAHYTYQLKCERAYRVVLRGLHSSENTSLIKEELKEQGHEVRHITNVFHRTTKEALPIFLVDLEPNKNNKDIFELRYLGQMKVKFEAPYKKKEIIQCKRCQRFGHTKNQCFRPFRCVKCGNEHPTTTCTKSANTDATCANCQEKHPASYKGCAKYKQYKEKILKIKPMTKGTQQCRIETQPKTSEQTIQSSEQNSRHPNQGNKTRSYADVTKERPPKEGFNDTENNSDRLEQMFAKFQQIMINMVDKMMDRMIQLVASLVTK